MPRTASLDTLPTELLLHIASYVYEPDDWKPAAATFNALQQVNRRLYGVFNHHLYHFAPSEIEAIEIMTKNNDYDGLVAAFKSGARTNSSQGCSELLEVSKTGNVIIAKLLLEHIPQKPFYKWLIAGEYPVSDAVRCFFWNDRDFFMNCVAD